MHARNAWFRPRGTLSQDGWKSVVEATLDGWVHTGLRVADLGDGGSRDLPAADVERIVVPLTGGCEVAWTSSDGSGAVESGTVELEGRSSVFDGPTDVVYLPVGTEAVISGPGRVAVAEAPATERHQLRVIAKDEVPVELRGAGRSSRQVHNFGTPGVLDAEKLIVCEVITPAENWSSYPAHKHDEHIAGHESRLEEIYYFESAPARGLDAPADAEPFGMFATYSSPAGEIDVTSIVHTGDVALVPYGYHGPAVAAPGYDLYYINVMAGPDAEREWLISDDPAHAWVRSSWQTQTIDPRLPYTARQATHQEGL
ncbi:5-deoxy-glucuronate isomerase [Promicromonospora soli]|uniref:5-deoxy-glucuronate isomerase n=1 Tax=Promicromonospora soli TaxID=2035533 RepID=A0A919L0C3_9MICO|nr:5-deoxy-glucuronate isomerase [Promicromonospora soli]GHH80155.1 5-deoxy-glucuronate isomerase [Promicromonospora soli]